MGLRKKEKGNGWISLIFVLRFLAAAATAIAAIAESELGQIFAEDGTDIFTAMKERATIIFVLNPLIYPELSPLLGRLILIDAKKAVSRLFAENLGRTFFIFDEINVYASSALIDLVNKSRSADVTCILATQSLSDLSSAEDEHFKEQVIENCNNYIVLRQNSAVNSEAWANVLGTRNTMEVTYQMARQEGQTVDTGLGSAKLVREYIYHPDSIKALKTGKALFLSRDTGQHCKVDILKPFILGGLHMEEIIDSYLDFAKKNPVYLLYSGLYYLLSVWLFRWQWWAWFLVAGVYMIAMIITFSAVGEWLMRTFNHVRPLETAREMNQLRPLFREVYNKAKDQNPELGRIDLYIVDNMKVSSFALGNHTIAVSKGAMHTFSEEEMRAVFAHEIAHILYRDTAAALYAFIGNGIFMALILPLKLGITLAQTIDSTRRVADFMDVVVGAIIAAFLFLMQIGQARSSRKVEKRADEYAVTLGYGEDLIEALYLLEKMTLGGEATVMSKLTASHPRISLRIGRLEGMLGVQVEE